MAGKLESALKARDIEAAAGLFATETYWRDLVSFTWNIATVEGRDGVAELLTGTLENTDPSGFATEEPPDEADGVITAWITFENGVGRGRGLLRLKEEDGEDRAWTLLTTLHELKGHEEPRGDRRPMGAEHGANKGRQTWLERQQEEAETLGSTTQPYVLVVGGGQAGIGLGARLRQLGIPSLVIDKHCRPGDQWRSRYKSLCLHDPVWYDHMPYLKFPDNWPVFSPKDKVGGLAGVLHPGDGGALLVEHGGDEGVVLPGAGEWTVEVEREGKPLTLKPKELVFATGMSGKPNIPEVPGADVFGATSTTPRRTQVRTPTAARRCRHREQQLGLRHLRRTVGVRRRRHDGAAVLDPHRQERQPDGHRARRPLLRARWRPV